MQLRKISFDDDDRRIFLATTFRMTRCFIVFILSQISHTDTRSNILRSHIDSQSSAFVNSSRHGASSMREYNL